MLLYKCWFAMQVWHTSLYKLFAEYFILNYVDRLLSFSSIIFSHFPWCKDNPPGLVTSIARQSDLLNKRHKHKLGWVDIGKIKVNSISSTDFPFEHFLGINSNIKYKYIKSTWAHKLINLWLPGQDFERTNQQNPWSYMICLQTSGNTKLHWVEMS